MNFLIDTHALIWTVQGDPKLSAAARDAIESENSDLFVSAVTAWEFADLRRRGRLPGTATFELVLRLIAPILLDLPADLWRQAERLPDIHGDPSDRMLVACQRVRHDADHGGSEHPSLSHRDALVTKPPN